MKADVHDPNTLRGVGYPTVEVFIWRFALEVMGSAVECYRILSLNQAK
jgi:hypothetical protein